MYALEYTINMQPGVGVPPVVNVSQGDIDREIVFTVMDGLNPYEFTGNETCVITGTKPSGLGFTVQGTVSESTITFYADEEMTQEAGAIRTELVITDSVQEFRIGSANFNLVVEPTTHASSVIDGTTEDVQTVLQECEQYANDAEASAQQAAQSATAAASAGAQAGEEAAESVVEDYYDSIMGNIASTAYGPLDTVPFEAGTAYDYTGISVGSTMPATPSSVTGWSSCQYECQAGDLFIVTARGGSNMRTWGFTDTDRKLLSVAASNTPDLIAKRLYAPSDGYFYVNNANALENPQVIHKRSFSDAYPDIMDAIEVTGDELQGVKEDLNLMSTATASDVGKALKAKTVTNGKVTEWGFGEAGSDTSNIITPEMYNAYGDGVHDDTEAITNAITACDESDAILQLNKKTYLVSTIAISKPITVQGFGNESIIKHNSDALYYGVVAITSDNVILRNFAIDGNSGAQTTDNRRGIYIGRKNHILIDNVTVHNCRNGIYIGYIDSSQNYLANDVCIKNCHIYNNTMNEIVVAHAKNIIFDGCYIDAGANDSSLIDIEAHADAAIFQNIVFANCYIKQNSGADIQCILNQYSVTDSKVIFDNCNIQSNIQITTMKNVSFIDCIIAGYAELKDCENTLISGCKFNLASTDVVRIYTRSYSSGKIAKHIILQNSILPTVHIQDATDVFLQGCNINRTKDSGPYGSVKGSVLMYGRADNVTIKDCELIGVCGVEYVPEYSEEYDYPDYTDFTCEDCLFDCSEAKYYGLIPGRNVLDHPCIIKKEYSGQTITCDVSQAGKCIVKDWTKNVLSPTLESRTNKGVTCVANGDGTFTLTGTATTNADFNVQVFAADDPLIGETITVTGVPSGGAYNTFFMGLQGSNSPWTEFGMIYSGSRTYTLSEACRLYIRIPSGSNLGDGVTFTPMAVKGSVAHDFVPDEFTITCTSADSEQSNSVTVTSEDSEAMLYSYNGGSVIFSNSEADLIADVQIDILSYIDSVQV